MFRKKRTFADTVDEVHAYLRDHAGIYMGTPYMLGKCNVCGNPTVFFCDNRYRFRESLFCAECLITSRYRSIARGILRAIGQLTGHQAGSISELDPEIRGKRLAIYDTQVSFYTPAHAYPIPDLLSKYPWINVELSIYRPQDPWGTRYSPRISNQNLEELTFPDCSFDIVITSDVMEHVRLDAQAHHEIKRVLKPGGIYLFTVPHFRHGRETLIRVATLDPSDPSKDVALMEPEYHGDANSAEHRALSYRTYGTDLDEALRDLGFTVEYTMEAYAENAIYDTELFYCRLTG